MAETLQLDYYYGVQAEQYSFFRIPRLLIKDSRFSSLSSDAKLLYGLMLDRMGLSIKNKWFDEQNRAYIFYTLVDIMDDLECAHTKAIKILAELTEIGLIERKKQGLGKPDIIFVKNFATLLSDNDAEIINTNVENSLSEDKDKNTDNTLESPINSQTSQNENSRLLKMRTQDFSKRELKTSQNENSRLLKTRTQDFSKSDPSYTNNNYTDSSYTDSSYQSYQSYQDDALSPDGIDADKIDTDEIDETESLVRQVKENIAYDSHMQNSDFVRQEQFLEIFKIICDIVCVERDTVSISGTKYPYSIVRRRFLQLDSFHVDYVIDSISQTETKVNNIHAYLVAALFNAPTTISNYYAQRVSHDNAKHFCAKQESKAKDDSIDAEEKALVWDKQIALSNRVKKGERLDE